MLDESPTTGLLKLEEKMKKEWGRAATTRGTYLVTEIQVGLAQIWG